MATADLALLLVTLAALGALLGVGGVLPRSLRWLTEWRDERRMRQERLRQEQLKTAVLEEQLRNAILNEGPRPRPQVPEER